MTIQFSFANLADAATLSAGSWQAGAPLANLQQEFLSKRARSTNDDLASTTIRIDFGAVAIVRLVAIARHNLSRDATYRVFGGSTAGSGDIYDSGTLPVWPAIFLPQDLEWENDNFWTGQISAAETVGYPISLTHDCGGNILARYWRIDFADTTNPDGYVELARLWMGRVWSPTRNYSYGASLTWEARDISEQSLGGVLFHDRRDPARVFRFSLKALTTTEATGAPLDAQRLLGSAGQLWVVPEPADLARGFKRNMLARMRRADPIAQAFRNLHETAFELEEIL